MKFAINLNAVLPVRAEAKESSEQVTQLLFGEYCTILMPDGSFSKIENSFDGYQGWVDTKMLTEISEEEHSILESEKRYRTIEPISDVFCLTDKSIYRLSAGSLIPNYDEATSKFEIGGLVFQIHPSFVTYLPGENIDGVLPTSLIFKNTPYLWGGKNIFGIDCSGLVQVVFSMNGILLPRDASQQIGCGQKIKLADASAGDLCFFEKEGRITHVGIYAGEGRIIHASGCVKVETVDDKGILSSKGVYTHNLFEVRTFKK